MSEKREPQELRIVCKEVLKRISTDLKPGEHWSKSGNWHLWLMGSPSNRIIRADSREGDILLALYCYQNELTVAAQKNAEYVSMVFRPEDQTEPESAKWLSLVLKEIEEDFLSS